MLNNIYLPLLITGHAGGGFNWMLLFVEVTMNIGIFTHTHVTFDDSLGDWRTQLPGHVYITSGGTQPPLPALPYWQWSSLGISFIEGITQETCRDIGHSAMGIVSVIYEAETVRIQVVDLYGENSQRLKAMLELHAETIEHRRAKDMNPAYVIPATIFGGTLNSGGSVGNFTSEIALNHFQNRLGQALPKTTEQVRTYRPMTIANPHMSHETLTHGDTGNLRL